MLKTLKLVPLGKPHVAKERQKKGLRLGEFDKRADDSKLSQKKILHNGSYVNTQLPHESTSMQLMSMCNCMMRFAFDQMLQQH